MSSAEDLRDSAGLPSLLDTFCRLIAREESFLLLKSCFTTILTLDLRSLQHCMSGQSFVDENDEPINE